MSTCLLFFLSHKQQLTALLCRLEAPVMRPRQTEDFLTPLYNEYGLVAQSQVNSCCANSEQHVDMDVYIE